MRVETSFLPAPLQAPRVCPVYEGPDGLTIAELVARVPDLPAWFWTGGRVFLDDHEILPELWHRVRPHGCRQLVLKPRIHGGGRKGKDGLQTVAAIALVATATAVSGGLLAPLAGSAGLLGSGVTPAAGSPGALALSALLGVGGQLLLGNLFASPVANPALESEAEQGVARAGTNVLRPNAIIPVVIGTRRVLPPQIMNPYTELQDRNEIGYALYALAGPHRIRNAQINGVPIDDLEGVEMEVVEGWETDPLLTTTQKQVFTQPVNITLSKFEFDQGSGKTNEVRDQHDPSNSTPRRHRVSTRLDPDEVVMRFQFAGIVRGDNETKVQHVSLRFFIRKKGEGENDWKPIVELGYRGLSRNVERKDVRFVFDRMVRPQGSQTQERNCFYFIRDETPALTSTFTYYGLDSGTLQFDSYWTEDATIRADYFDDEIVIYVNDNAYFDGDGNRYEIEVIRSLMVDDDDIGADGVAYNWLPTTNKESIFHAYEDGGDYKALVKGSVSQEQIAIVSVASVWNDHPAPKRGNCYMALRFTNTDVSQFTVQAQAYARIPDGRDFRTWSQTDNPAAHYREALIGVNNAKALPEHLLDRETLLAWFDECETRGHTADFVTKDESVLSVLETLAAAGRARTRQSDNWAVAYDHDRSSENPVQVFSPRNARGISFSRLIEEQPDSMLVTFENHEADGVIGQTRVANPFGGSGPPIAVEYRTIRREPAARARARYDMAQAFLRDVVWTFECGVERIASKRGDPVLLSTDILTQHVAQARIKSVDGADLVIDDEISYFDDADDFFDLTNMFTEENALNAGVPIYAAIRQAAGPQTAKVTGWNGSTKTVTLEDDVGAMAGDLIVFGPHEPFTARMLVLDIKPTNGLNAQVSLVPEAADLVNYL